MAKLPSLDKEGQGWFDPVMQVFRIYYLYNKL